MNKRRLAYLVLTLNAIIWGAALPIVKPALELVTPYQYLFYRYLVAAPFSIPPLVYLFYKYKPDIKQLFVIVGFEFLAIVIALSFLYEGLHRTSSIEAGLIANTTPIFITIGGVLFLKEKEELHELIGLTLAIIGVTLVTLEPLTHGIQPTGASLSLGNLIILGHNLCWTAYILSTKFRYRTYSKALIGLISVWVGLIGFGILTWLTTPELTPSLVYNHLTIPAVFWASLYMGILGSIIAVPAMIIGNDLIEASEASMFAYLQPLFYIPLGIIWLKEPLEPSIILGLSITIVGVIVAGNTSLTHKIILWKKQTFKS